MIGLIPFAGCARENAAEKVQPEAAAGILDLTTWDFERDGPIKLLGEWEFYWQQLLTSADFAGEQPPIMTSFIPMPTDWRGYKIKGKRLSDDGCATYRLQILLKDAHTPLAFKIQTIDTAHILYVNGKQIGATGVVGAAPDTTFAWNPPYVAAFQPEGHHLEVILQVADFASTRGGVLEVMRFGQESQIRTFTEHRLIFEFLLFGSILIMGLYHIGLYMLRKKDPSSLYFALFCVMMAIRILGTGEKYIMHLLPNIQWESLLKIIFLPIYISLPAFATFTHALFPQEFSKRMLRPLQLLGLILSGIVLVTSSHIYYYTLPSYELFAVVGSGYTVYVLVLAYIRKREGAFIFLLGFLGFFLTVVNDILYDIQLIHTGFLMPFGLFVFIFSQAFILSMRFSKAFSEVEQLSEELEGKNLQLLEADKLKTEFLGRLEQQVAERTVELRKLGKAVETTEVGVTITDNDGRIVYINPADAEMHGYMVAELLGQRSKIFAAPKQHDDSTHSAQLVDDVSLWKRERFNVRKDGSAFPVMLISNPIEDEQGQMIGKVTICEDITDRKRAEEALLAANNELKATLEHLQETQKQLIASEKMAALGQLIAGVAHEINTPLGAIKASIENMSHTLDQALTQIPEFFLSLSEERRKEFIALVDRAIHKQDKPSTREERQLRQELSKILQQYQIGDERKIARVLVDIGIYSDIQPFIPLLQDPNRQQILQMAYALIGLREGSQTILTATDRAAKVVFALKTYGRYDLSEERVETDITEGLETVLTLYHNQLKHGIEVIRNYHPAPPVRCYPDELNQVWTNLIHNAIQAMSGKGTLEITVSSQQSPASSSQPPAPSPQYLLVSITDSGCGIPDGIKDRIFEPFFTTKPAGEGSGLGLDICKKIIDKHQGAIEFESQPGRTTFSVWLPL